jgi:FixJ family two-component response regulator
MHTTRPTVFVVDHEQSVRASISTLLQSAGLDARFFSSAQQFLHAKRPNVPGCLVFDVRLPDVSGLVLQQQLANLDLPVIFVTRFGDVPVSVRAIKSGALEFLTKPYEDRDLLKAIQHAIDRNRGVRQQQARIATLKQRYRSLTPREQEVFPLVTGGMLNKQSAAQLGTSEKTIKVHRGRVMRKMHAKSLADLIRMGQTLGIKDPSP